ncbi:MAG: hypothetical protein A2046_00040 [Bacteroidetes bacterium GWA2_30_7]|nr:MAG: hypothetical protein A2046_00040 [Bacteroidetes bacterium GWA2_30_7]
MKKLIYISGIVTANLMLFGSMFKVMHWPGANVMLVLSIFIFCFWFLPAALINSYKNQEVKKHKWLYIITFIVFFINLAGALFKIMHWPGAAVFLLIGLPLPFVVFLPVYLYQTRNDKNNSILNFLGIMFGLTFLAVFSVLLALNISKGVLNNIALDTIKKDNDTKIYLAKSLAMAEKNGIKQKSAELCDYIDLLKCEIISAAEEIKFENNKLSPDFDIQSINNMDNTDIPEYVLFRKNGVGELSVLKQKIYAYQKDIQEFENKDLQLLSNSLFDISDKNINGQIYSWEQSKFPSNYLIIAIDVLSRIQRNVRFVESEILSE